MRLTVLSGAGSPLSRELREGSLTIGRATDCDIVVEDQFVSHHHAQIDINAAGVSIIDLGSTNGTYVDGEVVSTRRPLGPRSEIHIGGAALRLSGEAPTTLMRAVPSHDPTLAPTAPATVPAPGPQPAAPQYGIRDAGVVAESGDINLDGYNVAGRDLYLQEGFKLTTKMRTHAKNYVRLGVGMFLAGFATFGYFVMTWNSKIFDAVRNAAPDAQPNLPSPYPWLSLGVLLAFAGVVLVVVGLLIPRERVVTRQGR